VLGQLPYNAIREWSGEGDDQWFQLLHM
jgi:hypothetical protein